MIQRKPGIHPSRHTARAGSAVPCSYGWIMTTPFAKMATMTRIRNMTISVSIKCHVMLPLQQRYVLLLNSQPLLSFRQGIVAPVERALHSVDPMTTLPEMVVGFTGIFTRPSMPTSESRLMVVGTLIGVYPAVHPDREDRGTDRDNDTDNAPIHGLEISTPISCRIPKDDHDRCRYGCKEARTVDFDKKQESPDNNQQPSKGQSHIRKYHDHMFFVCTLKILWEFSGLNIKATGLRQNKRTGSEKDTVDLISTVWRFSNVDRRDRDNYCFREIDEGRHERNRYATFAALRSSIRAQSPNPLQSSRT